MVGYRVSVRVSLAKGQTHAKHITYIEEGMRSRGDITIGFSYKLVTVTTSRYDWRSAEVVRQQLNRKQWEVPRVRQRGMIRGTQRTKYIIPAMITADIN